MRQAAHSDIRTNRFWLASLVMFVALGGFATEMAYGKSVETLVMPGPVSQAHAKYEEDCTKCHTNFSKQDQVDLCLDCHKPVAKDLYDQTGFHGHSSDVGKATCKECHSEHLGREADIVQFDPQLFDHGTTDFRLKDGHSNVPCLSCHKAEQKFREAPGVCIDCHKAADPHKGTLGQTCSKCHRETNWRAVTFDHGKTQFALKGKHAETACKQCHFSPDDYKAPTVCKDCHAIDDTHQGEYGAECRTCHSEVGWHKVTFDHATKTKFKLTGQHQEMPCASCHKGGLKQKVQTSCASCHHDEDIHDSAMGSKCETCHTTASWQTAKFDHNRKTQFPLLGAHFKARCAACHDSTHDSTSSQVKLSKTCIGCHRADDVHAGQLGSKCDSCHGDVKFGTDVRFDHDLSVFPLIGLHAATACEACHQTRAYGETAGTCRDCHESEDKHRGALGTGCAACHSPNGWSYWTFDHERQTGFSLTDSHNNLECGSCHSGGGEHARVTGAACASCHMADDRHRGRFGRRCEQCHNAVNFKQIQMER